MESSRSISKPRSRCAVIGYPRRQAIDQHRSRRLGQQDVHELQRLFGRRPMRAAARAMRGDAGMHFLVARHHGCEMKRRPGRALDKLFGEAALARARAAENERDGR
jgi:hypothetical protein